MLYIFQHGTARDNSACLNAINEEDENHDNASPINSSWADSDEEKNTQESTNKTRKCNNNIRIPLWQQKIQNQEFELSTSPTMSLKGRLMKIEPLSESEIESDGETKSRSMTQTSTIYETPFTEMIQDDNSVCSNGRNHINHYHDSYGQVNIIDTPILFVNGNKSSNDETELILNPESISQVHSCLINTLPKRTQSTKRCLKRSSSERLPSRTKLRMKRHNTCTERINFGSFSKKDREWCNRELISKRFQDDIIANVMLDDVDYDIRSNNVISSSSSSPNILSNDFLQSSIENITSAARKCYQSKSKMFTPNIRILNDEKNNSTFENHLSPGQMINLRNVDSCISSECSDIGSSDNESKQNTENWLNENPLHCNGYGQINCKRKNGFTEENFNNFQQFSTTYIGKPVTGESDEERNNKLKLIEDEKRWSGITEQLNNLNNEETKREIVKLRTDIFNLKCGLDSLTDLVRTALYDNKSSSKT